MGVGVAPSMEAKSTRRPRLVAQRLVIQVATKLLLLIQTVVVARLYGPEALGGLALLLLIVNGVGTAFSPGLDRYLLQSDLRQVQRRTDTAFTLSLATALVAVGLLWAIAPWVLTTFRVEARVAPLRILALTLVAPATLLPAVLWERQLRLGRANIPAMLTPLLFSVLAVAGALAGRAHLSTLVAAQVGATAAASIVAWVTAPYRPRLSLEPPELRSASIFALPLLAAGFLGFLVAQGDDLLVRYFTDDRRLGLYTIAFYVPAQLLALVDVIGRLAISVMADLRDTPGAVKEVFAEFSAYVAILVVGLGGGIILLARPLVLLLYGPEWVPVVPLVRIFAAAFIIRGVSGFHWQALAILNGRTRYILGTSLLSVLFLALTAPALIWHFGLYGGALFSILQLAVMGPMVRFPLIRDVLGDLRFLRTAVRPLLLGAAAGIAGGVALAVGNDGWHTDSVAAFVFIAAYLALLARFEPRFIDAARGVVEG